jgi:hypothetical protein
MRNRRLIKLALVVLVIFLTIWVIPSLAAPQVLINLNAQGNHWITPATLRMNAGQVITIAATCTDASGTGIVDVHYFEVGVIPTRERPEWNESIYYRRADCFNVNMTYTAPVTAEYRFMFHVHTREYGCVGTESCPNVTGISRYNYTLRVTGESAGGAPTNTPQPSPTRVQPTMTPSRTPIPPTATATQTPVQPTMTPSRTPIQPTLAPSQTPVPPTTGTGGAVTVAINSSTNDVNEVGTTFSASDGNLWIGNSGTPTTSFTGLRFTGVNIPRGARITSALLRFYSPQEGWISISLQIAGEARADSATYSATSRPSQRTLLTTARVNHASNTRWAAGSWNTLEDVRAIVQELVNLPTWTTNSSISLILRGTGSSWGRKFARSFEAGVGTAPQLVITYTR